MCFFPDEKFRKTCAELQCIRTICTLRPFLAVNVPHKKISNIWPVVALAFLGTYSRVSDNRAYQKESFHKHAEHSN